MSRPGRRARPQAARALVLLCAALFAPQLRAEDVPCVLDKCLGVQNAPLAPAAAPADGQAPAGPPAAPSAPFQARRAVAPGSFDFYVLALSWSPGFCTTGGEAKAPGQCAAGSRLGFVVHGLWPQYQHGFPSDCGPAGRVPSHQALDTVRGVYPDDGLARYEWRKHGTCTGQSPTDYFADVRRARDAVTVPQPFATPQGDQTWVPIDIARAFVASNAGLRPDEMAVTCRQDTLEEVRVCLSKDLRGFVPCPEVSRASCRGRQISVPAPR